MKFFIILLLLGMVFIFVRMRAKSYEKKGAEASERPGKRRGKDYSYDSFVRTYSYLQKFGVHFFLQDNEGQSIILVEGPARYLSQMPKKYGNFQVVKKAL